jgi:hypothetical protein
MKFTNAVAYHAAAQVLIAERDECLAAIERANRMYDAAIAPARDGDDSIQRAYLQDGCIRMIRRATRALHDVEAKLRAMDE